MLFIDTACIPPLFFGHPQWGCRVTNWRFHGVSTLPWTFAPTPTFPTPWLAFCAQSLFCFFHFTSLQFTPYADPCCDTSVYMHLYIHLHATPQGHVPRTVASRTQLKHCAFEFQWWPPERERETERERERERERDRGEESFILSLTHLQTPREGRALCVHRMRPLNHPNIQHKSPAFRAKFHEQWNTFQIVVRGVAMWGKPYNARIFPRPSLLPSGVHASSVCIYVVSTTWLFKVADLSTTLITDAGARREYHPVVQYVTAEWKPAFLRQAREFLFFPLLPREASKWVSIFVATRFHASSPGYSPRGSRQGNKSRT